MVRAVRPLRSLSVARGCAGIRLDTTKIGSAGRVEVHHARLLAVIGVRKTFPHGLGRKATSPINQALVRSTPDSVAKVVLPKVSKILRAAGTIFV